MTLNVSLSRKAEAKLRKRAAAEGKDPTSYASDLLERAVTRPSLQELLLPSQAEFLRTGKTKQQVMEKGRRIVRRIRSVMRLGLPAIPAPAQKAKRIEI
jgi:hypothetical protein